MTRKKIPYLILNVFSVKNIFVPKIKFHLRVNMNKKILNQISKVSGHRQTAFKPEQKSKNLKKRFSDLKKKILNVIKIFLQTFLEFTKFFLKVLDFIKRVLDLKKVCETVKNILYLLKVLKNVYIFF